MNWFLNRCRRYRKCLCLMAGGLLSESECTRIEKHLAACADCRNYYGQVKKTTVSLGNWERHFAQIQPDATFQSRVKNAMTSANRRRSVRAFAAEFVLRDCWQQLVWPSRRIWASLAAVWILLLALNVSQHDSSRSAMAAASPEIVLSFQQQEQMLAELMGRDELHAAIPAKTFLPRPSSERQFGNLMT